MSKLSSRIQPNLTAGQLACLELVRDCYTSKEIAVRLGISSHTVDQRIRRALKVLNVETRSQAVKRLVREIPSPVELPPLKLPFATQICPRNTLSPIARLAWILGIGLSGFVSTALYLAGLKGLTGSLMP